MDKHGSLGSTYNFTCHGRVGATRRFSVAAKSTKLELFRGKANRPAADVCQGGRIRVAYSPYSFEVEDNKMVKYLVYFLRFTFYFLLFTIYFIHFLIYRYRLKGYLSQKSKFYHRLR